MGVSWDAQYKPPWNSHGASMALLSFDRTFVEVPCGFGDTSVELPGTVFPWKYHGAPVVLPILKHNAYVGVPRGLAMVLPSESHKASVRLS